MKHKLATLLLSGVLLCAMALPTMAAAETTPSVQEEQMLPHSALYYGQVTGLTKDNKGNVTQLDLKSESEGAYTMLISAETVWIDADRQQAGNADDLQAGEGVYVFHSLISTRSLPPQSPAFVVVRNIPQGMFCP